MVEESVEIRGELEANFGTGEKCGVWVSPARVTEGWAVRDW